MGAHYDYGELVGRVMQLWHMYHEKYVEMIPLYRSLLSQKRILNLTLHPMKESDIKLYPDIPFLRIATEKQALDAIDEMTPNKIVRLIGEIDLMVTSNYTYRTLDSKIYEYKYQIDHYDQPRSQFGLDPDAIIGKTMNARTSSDE